jgi:hypothetical protein
LSPSCPRVCLKLILLLFSNLKLLLIGQGQDDDGGGSEDSPEDPHNLNVLPLADSPDIMSLPKWSVSTFRPMAGIPNTYPGIELFNGMH